MKLEIDIPESIIRNAVEAQVSKEVASITTEMINKHVQAILNAKFERISISSMVQRYVNEGLSKAIDTVVNEAIGKTLYDRAEYIKSVINTQIKGVLKGLS